MDEDELDPIVDRINARQVAVVLGMTPSRVRQLLHHDLLPYEPGLALQLPAGAGTGLANARETRWHSG